jgi:capsid protein
MSGNTLQIVPFSASGVPGLTPTPIPIPTPLPPHRVLESTTPWFSELDYLKSRFMGNDGMMWAPVMPTPAYGSRFNRKDGRNQYTHWTEDNLLIMRDAARRQEASEPIAKGLLSQIINFTVCEGFTYKCVPRKELPPEQRNSDRIKKLAERCQLRIDDFWERYERSTGYRQTKAEFEREFVKQSIIDGERFLRMFRRPDGLSVRQLDPECVRQPQGKTPLDGWSMGVLFQLGDIVARRGYFVITQMDTMAGEVVPVDRVLHYTRNVPANVTRGVSDFFSLIDDLTDIGQLVDAIRNGAKQRAKIAIIRSHQDADADTLENFANGQAATLVGLARFNPLTNEQERISWTPDGAILDVGSNMDHKTMPQGATLEHIEAAKFCVYNLSCTWNFPNFMVLGDSNDYNYASVLVVGGPVTRRFKMEQGEFCGRFRQLMRKALEFDGLMGLGDIPEDVLLYIDIQVDGPDPVIHDRAKEVAADKTEIETGVVSVQTVQQKRGYDPMEEERNRQEYEELHPPIDKQKLELESAKVGAQFGKNDQEDDGNDQQ